MYCLKCGKILNSQESFCGQCGTKVQRNYNTENQQEGTVNNSSMFLNGSGMQLLYQTDCLSKDEKVKNWIWQLVQSLPIIVILILDRVARKDWGMMKYWRVLDVFFYICLIGLIITIPLGIFSVIYKNNARVYFYTDYLEGEIYRKSLLGNYVKTPGKIKLQYEQILNIQPYNANAFLITTNKESVLLRIQNPEIVYKILTNRT